MDIHSSWGCYIQKCFQGTKTRCWRGTGSIAAEFLLHAAIRWLDIIDINLLCIFILYHILFISRFLHAIGMCSISCKHVLDMFTYMPFSARSSTSRSRIRVGWAATEGLENSGWVSGCVLHGETSHEFHAALSEPASGLASYIGGPVPKDAWGLQQPHLPNSGVWNQRR